MVCQFYRFGDVFWFAAPRTPPLWQRGFFLVNCLVLRHLLASVRSGVVKTFRCVTLECSNVTVASNNACHFDSVLNWPKENHVATDHTAANIYTLFRPSLPKLRRSCD